MFIIRSAHPDALVQIKELAERYKSLTADLHLIILPAKSATVSALLSKLHLELIVHVHTIAIDLFELAPDLYSLEATSSLKTSLLVFIC